MKKQDFLQGSIILLVSVILTKLIGAMFKIPLSNILGGVGMGYFSAAYGLFMPIYALSVTGLPTAVAKLVAENSALKKHDKIERIKKLSFKTFGVMGMIASVILIMLAKPFTNYITEVPEAMPAVIAIAPSIFFGCLMAVYRGYYEGQRNMYPTAVSQVIEALVKLVFGLGGAYFVLYLGENNSEFLLNFIKRLTFSEILPKLDEVLIPYASAASILGITVSTVMGTLYLFFRTKKIKIHTYKSSEITSDKEIIRSLLKIMIPAAIGSLVTNLTSLVDLVTISKCIKSTILKAPQIFSFLDMGEELIPNFIYGSFIGLAVTVFNLVPSFTNMFGKGILPNLAEAWALKDMKKIRNSIEEVILITGIATIPCGIGISVLSKEIMELLFNGREMEIAVSYKALSSLGIGVIFLSFSVPLFSMLQAVGKAFEPVKIMLVGVVIKLIGNIILIPIPEINIMGAGISTTACYMVILFLAENRLSKAVGIKTGFLKLIYKPLISGILCGISARLFYELFSQRLSNIGCLLFSICFSGAIYLISLILFSFFIKRILKNPI